MNREHHEHFVALAKGVLERSPSALTTEELIDAILATGPSDLNNENLRRGLRRVLVNGINEGSLRPYLIPLDRQSLHWASPARILEGATA